MQKECPIVKTMRCLPVIIPWHAKAAGQNHTALSAAVEQASLSLGVEEPPPPHEFVRSNYYVPQSPAQYAFRSNYIPSSPDPLCTAIELSPAVAGTVYPTINIHPTVSLHYIETLHATIPLQTNRPLRPVKHIRPLEEGTSSTLHLSSQIELTIAGIKNLCQMRIPGTTRRRLLISQG